MIRFDYKLVCNLLSIIHYEIINKMINYTDILFFFFFWKIRLVTLYFEKMTLPFQICKIINTSPHFLLFLKEYFPT
jgi:hypothetical protein